MAASAICNEMGYDSSASTWENSNLWDSVQGSYDIALDDMHCSTNKFAECTYTTSPNCAHSEDVFLTCGKWRCRIDIHYQPSNRIMALGFWPLGNNYQHDVRVI